MTDTTTSAVAWRYRDASRDGSKWTVQKNRPDWWKGDGPRGYVLEPLFDVSTLRALAAERDRLRDALAPFAELSDIKLCGEWRDDESIRSTDLAWLVKFKMIRDARAALEKPNA